MRSLRLLHIVLPLASTVLAQVHPQPSKSLASSDSDLDTFRELLDSVPEESVHVALDNHLRPKYQNGVFEFDKAALERVHAEQPSLASKLVMYAAKLELLKRQSPNSTAVSTTNLQPSTTTTTESESPSSSSSSSSSSSLSSLSSLSSSSSPPPSSTTSQTSSSPIDTSTSVSPSSSVSITPSGSESSTTITTPSETASPESTPESTPEPTPSISIEVPVTTTDSAGHTITTSKPQPAVIISTTDSAGKETIITALSPVSDLVITTTDENGSTFVTTYTPGGGLVSSMVVITTTLPNGDVATITSYQIVNGVPTGSDAPGSPEPTASRGAPTLQSGAISALSSRFSVEAIALIGGAIGFAWLL